MRSYPSNRFVSGTRKTECARCGFDYLQSELIKEPVTGYLVCSECFDPKHPQDEPKNRPPRAPFKAEGVGQPSIDPDKVYPE